MVTKVTFTLDDETIEKLRHTADRIQKPRSYVVREAIRDYADRIGRLSEEERRTMLETFDRVLARIPRRPPSEVRTELAGLRRARKRGGRRTEPA